MKVGEIFRKRMAASIKAGVSQKSNTFVVSFTGVSSAKMDSLRKDLKRKQADVLVSKTSISRFALKEAKFESLGGVLNGQTAIVSSDSDASEISKILVKFAKDYQGFEVQGGVLDGAVLTVDQIKVLSDLPPRPVLLTKFLGLCTAPATRFAAALNSKTRDFMSILKQKADAGNAGSPSGS